MVAGGHVQLWRIAKETPKYRADDMTGAGAATTGNRWNEIGTPVVYCATSVSLASLELLAHLGELWNLRNYFLLKISVPRNAWRFRHKVDISKLPTWNAVPSGITSMSFGTKWANAKASLLLEVPSVIIPEEKNILINPLHHDAKKVRVEIVRQFQFDPRMDAKSKK